MRIFPLLAFLVCALSCQSHGPAAKAPLRGNPSDLMADTVVLVDSDFDGRCSGVWVSEREILTAAHCTRDSEIGDLGFYGIPDDVVVEDGDEKIHSVHVYRLVARDVQHDLALLKVLFSPNHGIATIADSEHDAIVGEPVQTMGHPLMEMWSYSTGVVAAVRVFSDDPDVPPMAWVQSTAPISPGNSGGGLFDAQGRLLGVAHAFMPHGENLNFYVHAVYVRSFLRDHASGEWSAA